ncbi:hypothetical protein NPIL_59001 [Nephila pilipes]|uniref:Uncharacterized protein n=1 Tax=Nephila pilipes TaxID=299642 RepID=A0A8X6QMS3_NEPPI|nr:hypothetical protein NPIL_59001 [Nephila pilipes]
MCLSVLDVGLNTYLLYIWKGDCQLYFQTIHLIYGIGAIIGPALTRSLIEDIQAVKYANISKAEDQIDFGHMPDIMFAYMALAGMTGIVTIFWMLIVFCPSSCYKSSRKIIYDYREPPKYFFLFALSTTLILCFISGCIDLGYHHMLATFAFKKYGLSTVQSADLTLAFWSCYTIGSFLAVFLSMKFHPFCMILCNLVAEALAAVTLILLASKKRTLLFAGNSLLGLGASSLFPCTVLWFHSYVKVTYKIMGVFLLSYSLAEMVIPEILGILLRKDFAALPYFVLTVSISYFIVLILQCMWFFPTGEHYVTDYMDNVKHSRYRVCPIFIHLRMSTRDSQTTVRKELEDIFEPRFKVSRAEIDDDPNKAPSVRKKEDKKSSVKKDSTEKELSDPKSSRKATKKEENDEDANGRSSKRKRKGN